MLYNLFFKDTLESEVKNKVIPYFEKETPIDRQEYYVRNFFVDSKRKEETLQIVADIKKLQQETNDVLDDISKINKKAIPQNFLLHYDPEIKRKRSEELDIANREYRHPKTKEEHEELEQHYRDYVEWLKTPNGKNDVDNQFFWSEFIPQQRKKIDFDKYFVKDTFRY